MRRRLSMLVLFAFLPVSVWASCPIGTIGNGWCKPVSGGELLGWGVPNKDFGNKLHLAQDYDADEGDPVYAVADGYVLSVRTDVTNFGGADNCSNAGQRSIPGGAIIVGLYNTVEGASADVLYAHVKDIRVSKGDRVKAGDLIAYVRNYTWCGNRMDHLHLGFVSPAGGASNPWAGYGSTTSTSGYGFVNPVGFMSTYTPYTLGSVSKDIFVADITNSYGVGWYPANVPCGSATNWYNVYYNGGTNRTATSATSSVCSQVPQTCHP